MNIIRKVHKINANGSPVPDTNYLKGRIGFWGLVIEQNSMNNTVTVVSDTGFQLKNIPVYSTEWVTVDENKDYIPSTRNLPPKNSRVFVLTPTFTAVGAFVLCSGYSRGDENIRKLWASGKGDLEDKNNCRETVTQGGWDITEEYADGNTSITSNDKKIVITINTKDNSKKSQKQEISIKAWDNSIVVNKDGINITDKNGNEIKMTTSDIQINAKNSNKIQIGNNVDTIKGLFDGLLQRGVGPCPAEW